MARERHSVLTTGVSSVGKGRVHLQYAADAQLVHRAATLRDAAYHDKRGADTTTAVKWWVRWTRALGQAPILQSRVVSTQAEHRAVESMLELFATWLFEVRGLDAGTVRGYVSTVMSWHDRRFGAMMPGYEPVRLRALLRGMRVSSSAVLHAP